MELIADALLLLGALAAALYCWVLSKRVKGLGDLDTGLGSAIASLSTQVGEMQTALKATQSATGSTAAEMEELVDRAERATENLKLMLATVQEDSQPKGASTARVRKFPTRGKAAKSEPEVSVEEKPATDDETETGTDTPSQATKLKEDVAEKLLKREDDKTRDELVEALQTILAANR